MEIVLASSNLGKLKELKALLANNGELSKVKVYSALDLDLPSVVEDAPTFEGNARKKATAAACHTGKICLADDSGLEVDALGDAPGVHSARFSGVEGEERDLRNNEKLLAALADVAKEKRTARFRCVVAIATPDGEVWLTEGSCQGTIGFDFRGEGGFGYDPLFLVEGMGKTMAELTDEEKNQLSHRGEAFRKAIPILKELLSRGE